MASIVLESKKCMTVPSASGNKEVWCFGMQLYTAVGGKVIPAKFVQTDECVEAFVGVYPFGGVVFSTASTAGTASLKITAKPLDGSAATTVTITANALKAIAIGAAVTA